MKILQLTCHFSPNVGGVETHLDDLVSALTKRKHEVFVLTYQPLTASVRWQLYEKRKNLKILRIPWISGFFYRLVKNPILEFLYLSPGIFLVTPFVLLTGNFDVIHSHGLVAGLVGSFWGKIFEKRVVVSLHSIYHFPKSGLYRNFAKWIFLNATFSMGLSKQSESEILNLGTPKEKVGGFRYWVDLNKFRTKNKEQRTRDRVKLGWMKKFMVLYVGRLVEEKGILVLLDAASRWNKKITLAIAGSGPLEKEINHRLSTINHSVLLGKIDNDNLPKYYNAADLVIVPSIHEEGFGRVILEALASGTPVIGANRGAIPEAMNENVGRLIEVTSENIKVAVEDLYNNRAKLKKLSSRTRKFAEKRYSEKNVEDIITTFE